ncbi:MAG: PQQ-binding-like beta-propeller repeat protein, partial [Planctomycetota bacterium]|nr:PQQ-binding-like beta-propeller repeat protein [Planctomycetota bacterium]
ADRERVISASEGIFQRFSGMLKQTIYEKELSTSLGLLKKGLPLYFSTLSPLEKSLTIRAGEFAAGRLQRLKETSEDFAKRFSDESSKALGAASEEERIQRLWEFPGTPAAQRVIDDLSGAAGLAAADARTRRWRLADAARICGLELPDDLASFVRVPAPADELLGVPKTEEKLSFKDEDGTAWLVLERRGNRHQHSNVLFLGGRIRKRFDNKFVVTAVDMNTSKTLWQTPPFRLRGKGEEPGFFEAFVSGDQVVVHGLYDVLAFQIADGKELWRHRVPFDFEIRHAEMNGDMLILAGEAETLALYLFSESPAGELAWQEKEEGDIYLQPYFHNDRLVSVRKLPFNVTVRYRSTGKLIGRLSVPDLSLHREHPLFETGHEALSTAHEGSRLVLTDGWYFINIDIEKMRIVWKRYIDANDTTRSPPIRFALGGDYLAIVKEDFDVKSIYMLSSSTGEILWHTDPKVADTPRPIHSMMIAGDKLFGIGIHPGQGFYWKSMDCKTGKTVFQMEVKGYQARPHVTLIRNIYGRHAVALIKDRQDFEMKSLNTETGKVDYTIRKKGVGTFGEHGRVSATVQDSKLVLLSKDEVGVAR